MGVFSQLRLLLWKNIKLRHRRPILTVTQLGWPILIFVVISILRASYPPKDSQECHFNARAVPSGGILPFMQSMVCDFDSPCLSDSVPSNEVPTIADAQIGKVVEGLDPLFQNDTILESVRALPGNLEPITELAKVVEIAVKNLTDSQPKVSDLFQDASQIREVFQNLGIPNRVSDAIFEATLDVLEVLDFIGSLNVDDAVCNETFLERYLTFPPDADVALVSDTLCNLTSVQRRAIANLIPSGLDVDYIASELEEFSRAIEPYTWEEFIKDLTILQQELEETGKQGGLVDILPQIVELSKFASLFQRVFEEYQDGQFERLFEEFAPLLQLLENSLGDLPWVETLTEVIEQTMVIVDALTDNEDKFIDRGIPFGDLVRNTTRLALEQDLPGDVVDELLSIEIFLADIPLLFDILEFPNRTMDLICSGNVTQDASVSMRSNLKEALVLLCAHDINQAVEAIRGELDVTAVLNELTNLFWNNRNLINGTMDLQAVFNQTMDLIDQLRNDTFLQVISDVLRNLENFDLFQSNPWLGLFLNASMDGLFGDGAMKDGSLAFMESLLQLLLPVIEGELVRTPLWAHVQKQLLIQYLYIDLQLHIVETFSSGNCPDGWHSQAPSCYQYEDTWGDVVNSISKCQELHQLSHPVAVNNENEQKFLEEIGEDVPVWLGIDVFRGTWVDGNIAYYTNWGQLNPNDQCGVANFGDDGLWMSTECSRQIARSLCEVPQEHALITLIKNSPQDDLTDLILQIGPAATEVFLKEVFSPMFIESIINSTISDVTFELCTESFLEAITPLVSSDLLTEICSFDPVAFWESQTSYWNFPEIDQKISNIISVSLTQPSDLLPSQLEPASFESLISKQIELQETIANAALVPFNPALLAPDVDVTGTPEEWGAAFERLSSYWNQQLLDIFSGQLSGSLFEEFAFSPVVQEQFAIQEVIILAAEAANSVFKAIEDLSVGNITAEGPQSAKFLSGIRGVLKQFEDISTAIIQATDSSVKATEFYTAVIEANLFCNATVRSVYLQLSEESQNVFDDIICDVNYPQLYDEVKVWLQIPDIEYLIQNFIPYRPSNDMLLPIPDQQESQAVFSELVANLMNIDDVVHQYIQTYELTFMENILPAPNKQNETSVVGYLTQLKPLLMAVGFNIETITLLEDIIRASVPWDNGSIGRILESISKANPLLENAYFLEPLLEDLMINDLFTVTISDILVQLTGEVFVFPDDLGYWPNAEEIMKLVPVVENFPDVVQVMLGILDDDEKATQLFSSDDVRSLFCSDTDFLNTSFAASVDLVNLQNVLCDVSIIAIASEASSLPAVQRFYQLGNQTFSSEFNVTAYSVHQSQFNVALEDFIANPLKVKVSQPWLNSTRKDLLQVLTDFGNYQSDPARLAEIESVLTYIDQLEMANVTLPSEIHMAVQTVIASLSYANDILGVLPGQNITFGDILPSNLAEFVSNSIYYGVDINLLQLQALVVNQDQLLVIAENGNILKVICSNSSGLEGLLVAPPGVNLTAAHQVLCSLNETAIEIELMREVAKIKEKAQVERDVEESMAIIQSFVTNVAAVLQLPPNFVRFDEEWFQTNAMKWEAAFKSLEEAYNSTIQKNRNDFGVEMLFNLLQKNFGQEPWFQPYLVQIRMEDYVTSILIEKLTEFKGKNISYETLDASLEGLPTLQEVLTFREVIPDMVDVLLALISDQNKITEFFSSPSPFATACASGRFQYFFQIPENSTSTTDVAALEMKICNLNKTALLLDVDQYLGITEIQAEVYQILLKDPSLPLVNLTAVYLRDAQLESLITELVLDPPVITVDQELWQQATTELEAVLTFWQRQTSYLYNPLDPTYDLTSFFEMINRQLSHFENDTWYQEAVKNQRLQDYVNILIADWLNQLQGETLTLPTLDEIFGSSQNIQELLRLTDLAPDVIEVFLTLSLQQDKWTAFVSMPTPIATLCASGNFTQFFQLPPDSTSNITAIANVICSVNMTAIDVELKKVIGLTEIETEIMRFLYNSPTLGRHNWTASYLINQQLQAAIVGLLVNPPSIAVDPMWLNETQVEVAVVVGKWLQQLSSMPVTSPSAPAIINIIEEFVAGLEVFANETWYQDVVEQRRINDLINSLLIDTAKRLQGQTLTLPRLEEIFENTTYVKELLELSDLTSDIVEAFLGLTLQMDKWNAFWTMTNPIATLCVSGEFTDFFQLPPDSTSDIDALSSAICSVNITAVDKELSNIFNLDEILLEFSKILYNDPSLGPYNWTASYILSQRVTEAISGLVTNPPDVRVDFTWWNRTASELQAVLLRWSSLGNSSPGISPNMNETLEDVIRIIEEQLSPFQNETWYMELIMAMRVMDSVNQILIDWANSLAGQPLTLPTLDEIFGDTTHVRQLLLSLSGVTPDIADAFLSLSLQEEKWESFWIMKAPISTLCASGEFESFFELPPDSTSNITAVSIAICSVNVTAVEAELREVFILDQTLTQVSLILYNQQNLGQYNWTASYQLSLDVQQAIEDLLLNPPQFIVDPIWFNQTRSDLLEVIERWWNALLAERNDPTNQLTMLVELLESQFGNFQNESWYQEIITQMRLMDHINQIIINWSKRLAGTTITIPQMSELFQNSSQISDLLALQDIAPELVDVFLSLSVQPEKWEMFWSLNEPVKYICQSGNFTAFFTLPPGSTTDIALVEDALCSIDTTALDSELVEVFGLDRDIAKIALILANDPSLGPYNWTASYILSMQVQDAIASLLQSPFYINVDPVWWNSTRAGFLEVLQQWSQQLNQMIYPGGPSEGFNMQGIFQLFESALAPVVGGGIWPQAFIQQMRIMDEVNKIILRWTQELRGTTITLPYFDGLLDDSAHVRQLLALQDLTPEFIEIVLSLSMHPEKFVEFFELNQPLVTICRDGSLADYFFLPPGSNVDLLEVQMALCSINLTAVETELKDLIDLDSVQLSLLPILYNDPSLGPYNWTASMILSRQVQDAITELLSGPPLFEVDEDWLNNTQSLYGQLLSMLTAPMSLESSLDRLESSLRAYGIWNQVELILNMYSSSLTLGLAVAQAQADNIRITLDANIPPEIAAQNLSYTPEELQALAVNSGIFPSDYLAYFYQEGLWNTEFCNDNQNLNSSVWFRYPPSVNSTALNKYFCDLGPEQYFQDLEAYYGYNLLDVYALTQQFGSFQPSDDYDWGPLMNLTDDAIALLEEISKLPETYLKGQSLGDIFDRLSKVELAVLEKDVESAIESLGLIVDFFDKDSYPYFKIQQVRKDVVAVDRWMNFISSENKTAIKDISPVSACEMFLPVITPFFFGPYLVIADLSMQVINQLYFGLPEYEEEIQALLNDQTLVNEFLLTASSFSTDISTSWEVIQRDHFQFYLLRILALDVIQGKLGDATCSSENLRKLLGLSDLDDIEALSTFVCSSDAIIQTDLVQEIFAVVDFDTAVSKLRILEKPNGKTFPEFSCTSFVNNGQAFTRNVAILIRDPTAFQLNLEIPGLMQLVDKILSMIGDATRGEIRDLESLLDALQKFSGGDIFDESTVVLIQELIDQYELYLDSLNQQTGLIPVYSVWYNSSDVASLLLQETGLSPENVTTLLDGYLNSTQISELPDLTVVTWSRVICEEDAISRLLVLPSDELEDLVYRELCQHPNKEPLFEQLQQMFSLFNFLRETAMSSVPQSPSFADFLLDIVARVDGLDTPVIGEFLEDTLPALQEVDDVTDLVELIPGLDNITVVLDSFEEIFENLEPLLGGSPLFQQAKGLLELLIEKQYIVDVLKEIPDLTIRKILRDPDDFQDFLKDEIGIDGRTAESVLDSAIRIEVLLSLGPSNIGDEICSEELFDRYLVFVEGTNVTAVVETLCREGRRDPVKILSVLLTQLNLTRSLESLTSTDITELFSDMTGSLDNITIALEGVQTLQEALPQLLESTSSLEGVIGEDTIEKLSRGDTAALFEDNPELFCGGSTQQSGQTRKRRQAPVDSSRDFCDEFYGRLQEGEYGDLQFAYLKPILLGKIFYSPDNPVTRKIIEKVSRPFQDILNLQVTAQAWLDGAQQLTDLLSSEGLKDIQRLVDNAYVSQLLETETELDPGSLRDTIAGDIGSLPAEKVNQLTVLAELVVNVTKCIDLDRFVGFNSEVELEEEASSLNVGNMFLAAIQFYNLDELEEDSEIPKHVRYGLRMDSDRTPTTRDLMNVYWYQTGRTNFATEGQYLHGYVFLQDLVERAIIELHADDDVELSDVYIQQMPYPCHQNDRFLLVATLVFPLLFTVGFLVLVAVMTHQLVYEKERGIEELMKVMGLQSGINWLAWFIVNAVLLAVLMLIITIIVFIGGLIIHSNFLLVLIFFLCYGLSLIMLSYMSSSFFHKSNIASLGSVLIYFFFYLPFGFVYIMRADVSRHAVYLMSLAAPTAFCFGSLTMTRYEHQGIGSNWENVWDNPRYEDVFNMAGSCLMLLVDSLIYFIIGWYVRTVFPGKYGVPRKWYFPFQPSYWFRRIRRPTDGLQPNGHAVNEAYPGDTPLTDMGAQVEAEPQDRPVGIAIDSLSKIYDTRCSSFSNKALDEMSLNVFEGQVTALLGSNGAGKTTTISIITGMFPATSGSVSIYGKQVGKAGGRSNDLGLCPQHNALYEELTVKEHLMIYGKLQGLDTDDIKEHGVNLLEDLQLLDMLQVPVRNLSGGMKRKLCVAISMVGDAKTVILDEPTSGVDPHARRAVWDLIIRSKPGRTIILCTHFMDEADLLGDRIAILDRGQLRCCGSSGFLKSKYTTGVKLTLTKERPSSSSTPETVKKLPLEKAVTGNEYSELPTAKDKVDEEKASTSSGPSSSSGVSSSKDLCDSGKVTEFLTSKVGGIKLIKDVGSEMVYQLPSSPEEKTKYPQLFRDLDKQLNNLHIRNYGVSDTKLEEVFLKVSTHSDSFQESNVDQRQEDSDNDVPRRPESQLLGVSQKDMYGSSFTKVFQQFSGVLLKRFHITRRDWRGFIWAVLMPVVFLTMGTVMTLVSPRDIHPQLQLTPAMFRDPNYVFFSNGETESVIGQKLTDAFFDAPGIGTTCMSDADQQDLYPCTFRRAFSQSPLMSLTDQEKQDILKEDLNSPKCVCTEDSMSECPAGSGGVEPPHWVTNTSALIQDLSLKRDINDYILNTRHIYQQERYGGLTLVDVDNRTVLKAWYSNIGHHAMPTYINVANNVLLRASIGTQDNPAEYGITAYNHPLDLAEEAPDLSGWLIASSQFGLLMFLTSALALIPSTLATLMVQENINGAKRLHFVSGATPLTYWLTNLLWDWLVYLVPATLMVIVLAVCNIDGLTSADNLGTFILLLLLYGFAILTQYYCLAPFFGDPGTAFVVYFCGNLLIFIMTNLPSFLNYLQLSEPLAWADTLGYLFLIFTPYSISSAILRLLYNQLEVNFYVAYGVPAQVHSLDLVKWNILSMILQGVIAFTVLIVVEHLRKQRVKCSTSDGGRVSSGEDEDVEEERKRLAEGGAAEDIISLKDVTKVYKLGKRRITAVDHISLGVPRGECFGLLGVNGAGKTTLFRTITTDLQPSDGTITINTDSIGYCPQMDAIYDQMTGEEILFCYARVKGIKERHVADVVGDMVSQLQMERFVGDVISTYSGGMKRTLSVAIALLGNPELVLMDEPTSGMDPVSKQTVWKCIQSIIMEGRSVIVTSHSMEECENLCTRLAIMVNGNFRCLGSPQHVKHRHGEGYTLILHLLSGNKPADIRAISQFMNATFPNNVLKEHHLTMLRYQLSTDRLVLADIYEAVESKRTLLGIKDYSVTQTTLDQVHYPSYPSSSLGIASFSSITKMQSKS